MMIVASVDGSCKGNGMENCRASYCFYIATGKLRGLRMKEVIQPCLYSLDDDLNIKPLPEFCANTNNRAEFLGGCWLMRELLLNSESDEHIMIISDSRLFVRMITKWYQPGKKYLNTDLIEIAYALYLKLCSRGRVTIQEVRSHRKPPQDLVNKTYWVLNDYVDRHAYNLCHVQTDPPGTQHITNIVNPIVQNDA